MWTVTIEVEDTLVGSPTARARLEELFRELGRGRTWARSSGPRITARFDVPDAGPDEAFRVWSYAVAQVGSRDWPDGADTPVRPSEQGALRLL